MKYLISIIVKFGIKGINFVIFLLLAKELSTNEFGIYGLFLTTSLLLAIFFDYGLRNTLAVESVKSHEKLLKIASSFKWIILLNIILISLFYLFFFEGDFFSTSFIVGVSVVIYSVALTGIRTLQGFYIANNKLNFIYYSDIFPKIVTVTFITILIFTRALSLESLFFIMAASSLFSFFYLYWNLRGMVHSDSGTTNNFELMGILKNSMLFMFTAFSMLLGKKASIFIVGQHYNDFETGVVFSILRVTELTTEIVLAISLVLLSSHVKNKKSLDELQSFSRILNCFMTFVTILLLLIGPVLLAYMFSSDLSDYSHMYYFLTISTYIGLIPTMLFPMLPIYFSYRTIFYMYFSHAFITVLSIYFSLRFFTFEKFAAVTIATSCYLLISLLYIFRKKYKVKSTSLLLLSYKDVNRIKYKLNRELER